MKYVSNEKEWTRTTFPVPIESNAPHVHQFRGHSSNFHNPCREKKASVFFATDLLNSTEMNSQCMIKHVTSANQMAEFVLEARPKLWRQKRALLFSTVVSKFGVL